MGRHRRQRQTGAVARGVGGVASSTMVLTGGLAFVGADGATAAAVPTRIMVVGDSVTHQTGGDYT
nr:hypothetical protein [Micromonospora sp. DSM 115978]